MTNPAEPDVDRYVVRTKGAALDGEGDDRLIGRVRAAGRGLGHATIPPLGRPALAASRRLRNVGEPGCITAGARNKGNSGVTITERLQRLRLPAFAAPMFLMSGPELVIAACRAGVVGSVPTINARTESEIESWLVRIEQALAAASLSAPELPVAPYAVNLLVQGSLSPRFAADLALIERFKPPIVITSVGPPGEVAKRVHDYGGVVFHDVATLRHAAKAAEQGVDGLILLTAGAGGHTGSANPFAFVPQVRRQFDGAC
jgi:hypothetical protein